MTPSISNALLNLERIVNKKGFNHQILNVIKATCKDRMVSNVLFE